MKRNVGLKRANPDALKDNFVKQTECDSCGTIQVCEDMLEDDFNATDIIESFTFDGKMHPLNIEVRKTAEIEDAISSVIETKEVNTKIKASYDGTTLKLTHEGAYVLGSIVVAGNAATTTRKCQLVAINCYKTSLSLSASSVKINGSSSTLANSPYSAYDSASATQLQGDLNTLLSTSVTVKSINVTAESDYFSVEVCIHGTSSISIDDKMLVWCKSYTEYQ